MSSDDSLSFVLNDAHSGHEQILRLWHWTKARLKAGKRMEVTAVEWQDDMSARQRRFLHGPVLGQITEQARGEDGQRYAMPVWKELFRQQFLGSAFEMVAGRAVEIRRSTEDLGIKAYSEYIDLVIAEAATTWGVEFRFILDEREAVRYKPAPARRREEQGEPA